MQRVRLIHWNEIEAQACLERIREGGFEPEFEKFSRNTLRKIKENIPDVIVIDLSRLPSQGRDMGFVLRKAKATRHVPLVFCAGSPEKVEKIQDHFPDAVFSSWDTVLPAIEKAVANQPESPAVPESVFEAYKGTPLPKKLGIESNSSILLIDAPEEFECTLGKLPEGVRIQRGDLPSADITLWFVRSRDRLVRSIGEMTPYSLNGGLWIIWPKKSSGVKSDVSQNVVRKVGLASGMVDYKICSIDPVWSGLRFTQRRSAE
jgi:hypothetical protein